MAFAMNAPFTKYLQEGKRSFAQTLISGVGDGYAVYPRLFQQISPGERLILLDKDTRRRAEGILVGLQPNGWTLNGIQRYDVLMRDMAIVPYQSIPLERTGVAVF
jgi:hypothetical protein